MSNLYKLPLRQSILTLFCVLFMAISVAGPAAAQSDRTFVIGEISSIPGGGVPSSGIPTSPVSTPTSAPATLTPSATPSAPVASRQLSFRASLAELGYVEGKNLTYIFDAQSIASDKLDAAAQRLVEAHVNIIVAYGTQASVAAKKAVEGTNIPVVFVGPVDPVQLGLVKSLQNTEGNVTGVGGVSEAYAKQLELMIQIVPTIHKIYLPYPNLTNPITAASVQAIQDFAKKSGVEVITAIVPTTDDVAAAIAAMPDVDAIMVLAFTPSGFVQAALDRKIPVSGAFPGSVNSGSLLSYNYTEDGVGSAAARFADRILRGAKPSDLPVEIAPSVFAINIKTADAIGLTIPDDILQQATIIVR